MECQHWCIIDSKGGWKVKNDSFDEVTPDGATVDGDGSCYQKLSKSKLGPNLEDDYNKAIARNIAIEVLKIKQQQQKKVHLWENFPSLPQ